MRPGFTDTLSDALRHADEAARHFGQEFVGTEHLLMGILETKTGDAFKALQTETNVEQLMPELVKAMPSPAGQTTVTGRLPLSPRAQRVVNAAISEAQAARQPVVSTRFLLMCLISEADSAACEILSECGADIDELRGLLSRGGESAEK